MPWTRPLAILAALALAVAAGLVASPPAAWADEGDVARLERRTIDASVCRAQPCLPRRPYRRFRVELEGGPVWQTRNDARVPGDTGTDVDVAALVGSGPFPYGRITFDWRIARKHGLRALVAPLQISGTGTLPGPTRFDNVLFAPGLPTKATYRFNSYRVTWRYYLVDRPAWTATVGVTVKVRDALTRLEQAGRRAEKTDLGVVPLLHLDAAWRFAPRWTLSADLDGWAVPQGRAFDFALKLHYDLSRQWSIGLGYRTIEGGADVDSVYTFAWFHQALVSVAFRF